MKEATSRLLVFSKEFFISGEQELDQNTSFSRMQAVLKFHDSVEYCVRAIIEEHAVNHDKNAPLFNLMKSVDKALASKELPLASQMDFLNTTRANVKHYASIPSPDDTRRCYLYAMDFLKQTTINYLDIDFLSVSRLLLIENLNVRRHLELADEKRKEGDYLEALIDIKKAFYRARPSNCMFVSQDVFSSGPSLTFGLHDIREFREPIEKLDRRINELEDNVALLLMGADVMKLRRFEEITPHFTFTGNGGCIIYWDDSVALTEELTQEAANYVVDMTLLWERMGVVGNHPVGPQYPTRKPWRKVRREEWFYIDGSPATTDESDEQSTE
jgi:hypothetical protein